MSTSLWAVRTSLLPLTEHEVHLFLQIADSGAQRIELARGIRHRQTVVLGVIAIAMRLLENRLVIFGSGDGVFQGRKQGTAVTLVVAGAIAENLECRQRELVSGVVQVLEFPRGRGLF